MRAVDAIGLTVADANCSVEFFEKVLSFEKVSDEEVIGKEYEQRQGVFGLRMRVVRMKLGDEFIELRQYLALEGRALPADSRSNDRWFQHVAIITRDMDQACDWRRRHNVRHASPAPSGSSTGTRRPAAKRGQRKPTSCRLVTLRDERLGFKKGFLVRDPNGHAMQLIEK